MNQNIDVHGVYSLFNTGGIEVHIEEGCDPFILWRFSIIDTKPQKWRKAKINYTKKGAFSGLLVCGFICLKFCEYNGLINSCPIGYTGRK